jgi:ribonuclease Z
MAAALLYMMTLLPGAAAQVSAATKIVFLGTGTPRPVAERSGPAVCIIANATAYLVDFGPGVVRRASEAARINGAEACAPTKLKIAFATHLHSDHTAGLSDLFLTPAVVGRHAPLELYGPAGIADMSRHVRAAYAKDIELRTKGLEHGDPKAYVIHVHEIKAGIVYKDPNLTVTAFLVPHGSWDQAFGYRFDAPGRSIVISGDTAATDAIARNCQGCDVLIHEVYSAKEFESRDDAWKTYLRSFHTSSSELGEIATKARPGMLILYHQLFGGEKDEDLVGEVRRSYSGKVVSARDLDVY